MMDEGKHEKWGEGFPDMDRFSDRDYQFPESEYRPSWRADVPHRCKAYSEPQLSHARSTLLRELVIPPANKPNKWVNAARILGIPDTIPDVVVRHIETRLPYEELESDETSAKNMSGQIDNENPGTSVSAEVDLGLHTKDLVDDLTGGMLPKATRSEVTPPENLPIMQDPPKCISKDLQPFVILKTLTRLRLTEVMKCDYCQFTFSFQGDRKSREVMDKIHGHLKSACHFSATVYFGRIEDNGTITLTERYFPMAAVYFEAYLRTVLAICPTCGFVFETIHHCATHGRYVHNNKNSTYGLVKIAKTEVIHEILATVCKTCNQEFENFEQLKRHEQEKDHRFYESEIDGSKLRHLIHCPLCLNIYINLPALRSHFESEHKEENNYPPAFMQSFLGREKDGFKPGTIEIGTIPIPGGAARINKPTRSNLEYKNMMDLIRNGKFFSRIKGYPKSKDGHIGAEMRRVRDERIATEAANESESKAAAAAEGQNESEGSQKKTKSKKWRWKRNKARGRKGLENKAEGGDDNANQDATIEGSLNKIQDQDQNQGNNGNATIDGKVKKRKKKKTRGGKKVNTEFRKMAAQLWPQH